MSAVVSFLRGHTIYALILLLVVFVLGVELARPGTVTPLWASNTILFAAPLAIMAGGQTLVMLTGGIDLSVASVATGRPICSRPTPPPAPPPRLASRFSLALSLASSTASGSRSCACSRWS